MKKTAITKTGYLTEHDATKSFEDLSMMNLDNASRSGIDALLLSLSHSVNSLQEELKNKLYQLQKVNEELKIRKEFISSVTSVLPEIIFIYNNKTNTITYSNRCYGKHEQNFEEYECFNPAEEQDGACVKCNFKHLVSYYNNMIMQNCFTEGEKEMVISGQKKWFKTVIKNFEFGPENEIISTLHIVTDITSFKKEQLVLKEQESELSRSLMEKDLLLQEVHHRVKNNLQIIISMIDLKINRIDNGEARDQLKEITNRIHSISLIHEELYQSGIGSCVDISKYTKKLGSYLSEFYAGQTNNVNITFNIQPNLKMTLNKAIPFGLLANEIICNSYKHAFTESSKGEIIVSLYLKDDHLVMKIEDNGKGINESSMRQVSKKKSFGMKLINGLILQLGGTISFACDGGCSILVEIPNFNI